MFPPNCRFPISHHTFSGFTLRPYHRPIIFPFHGIKHQTSSHIVTILKRICPRLAFGCFHITALVHARSCIINIILNQHFCFIRPVKIPGTANHLYTVVSQCGIKHVVPSVSLICMTSFKQVSVSFGSSNDKRSFIIGIEHSGSIIFQPCQINLSFSMSNILLSVVIYKKARIIKPLVKFVHFIRPFGFSTLKHHKTVIRDIDAYIISAVMISDGRRPTQTAICSHFIFHPVLRTKCDAIIRMPYYFPINQVLRMTNRDSRHSYKR